METARPLVSVVVPVYNGERFVGEALDSIFAQSYAPLEVIAVDDGSTDGSAALLAARVGVRVVSQANRGVAAARNAGVGVARGEFVAFLDQDDRWLPGKLAAQVPLLLADPGLDLVMTWVHTALDEGQARPGWLRAEHADADVPGFFPGTWLVRRSCFERVGLFDEGFRAGGDDPDWLMKFRGAGLRHEMAPGVLVWRRIHQGNQSRRVAAAHHDLVRVAHASLQRRRRSNEGGGPPAEAGPMARDRHVSVIVPVFDGERYLGEALRSILAQGPAVREVIVVDDGSTDGSGEVARSFGAPVRVVRQENGGPASARNRGLAEASAPYVAFLDADDVWEPDSLEPRLAALEADPGLGVAFGLVEQFVCPSAREGLANGAACPVGRVPGLLPGGILCRRQVFERVGRFDERFRTGEFVDWCARARELGVLSSVVHVPCLRRRWHGGNLTLQRPDLRRDYVRVAKAALDRRRAAPGPHGGKGR